MAWVNSTRRPSARARLLAGTALAGFVALLPSPAAADCNPAAANNVVATCTGTTINQGDGAPGTSGDTNGYGTIQQTGMTVNVESGATVTGSEIGIEIRFGTVNNSGAITGNGGSGTAGINGAVPNVVNNAGATITGFDGIRTISGAAFVTNAGTITGVFNGVNATQVTTVTNLAGGTITGGVNGISAGTGIANITNSGTISGATAINASAGGGGSSVFNAGVITGTAGTAIQFGGSSNILTLAPGSTINGLVTGGANNIS